MYDLLMLIVSDETDIKLLLNPAYIHQPTWFRECNEPGLFYPLFSNEDGMVFNLTHKAG